MSIESMYREYSRNKSSLKKEKLRYFKFKLGGRQKENKAAFLNTLSQSHGSQQQSFEPSLAAPDATTTTKLTTLSIACERPTKKKKRAAGGGGGTATANGLTGTHLKEFAVETAIGSTADSSSSNIRSSTSTGKHSEADRGASHTTHTSDISITTSIINLVASSVIKPLVRANSFYGKYGAAKKKRSSS